MFEGMYVLPCVGDVQLGLSEGLGQPTNNWSQWAGEDATLPSSESTPPFSIKQRNFLNICIVLVLRVVSMYECI